MAQAHPNRLLHHICHLVGLDPDAGLTDGELLQRFLADRDEAAVDVLVRRYGRLVFGVCRRVLHNEHAAEDAFQATFLVLTRKAPELLHHQPLGGWLYRVAYRMALRARDNDQRRQRREAQAARRRPQVEDPTSSPSDVVVALEEELQRLPERHRAPLVLCYVEGKTNEQAAQLLGCPPGSMSARLAQARQRLHAALAGRGYAVPAAAVSTLLAGAAAEAAVPLPLLANTVRAVLWFPDEGASPSGLISGQALALARGTCRAMFVNKLGIAAAVLLGAAMLGTGARMLLKAAPPTSPPQPAREQPSPEDRLDRAEAPDRPLPRGALARMGTTQLRHGDVVCFAAYTPDGKGLMTAARDGTVRLWDLGTHKELRRFDLGSARRGSVPEPSNGGLLEELEQQTWAERARSSLATLSPDGKVVAASCGGVVCLWEAATGRELRRLTTGQQRLEQLAFSADGRALLTLGPRHALAVWEVATGRCVRRGEDNPAAPSRFSLLASALAKPLVSPGWKYLAFVETRDGTDTRWVHIRDLTTGKELPPIEDGLGGLRTLCFSADDKTLVWDSKGSAIVLSDVATGRQLRRLEYGRSDRREDYPLATALSADGKSLAVCWWSRTIGLWDLASGQQAQPLGKAAYAQFAHEYCDRAGSWVRPALAFSPDGKWLASSLGGEAIRQFRTDTGAEVPAGEGHRGPVSRLALSADGRSLYTYGRGDSVHVWDWGIGKQIGQHGVPAGATHVVFTGDGRLGFAADYDFTFRAAGGQTVWTIAEDKGPAVTGISKDDVAVALALSPDGSLVAMRNWPNPEVHLRDATTGEERRIVGQARDRVELDTKGHLTEVTGVVPADLVFSPDGRYLAGAGQTRQLCLWEVATGTLLWQLDSQTGPAIERFAFSPSGLCLATLNADLTVTLYEVATGAKRGQLGEPAPNERRRHLAFGGVRDFMQMRRDVPVCLAFSPDGRYLATANIPEIHVWDVLKGREVETLRGHEGGVVSLLFAPDGKHLFSGGTDTTVLTWDLARFISRPAGRSVRLQGPALEALWSDLASNDAVQAFTAMRQLCGSHDEAISLIKQRVRPTRALEPEQLAKLIAELDSSRFERRRQAESELAELGELAEPALRQALAEGPPLSLRQRLEQLLNRLSNAPPTAKLRELRAVEVLELIGTPEAHQVLQGLADGATTARLTRQVNRALHRLGQ
jgi:RNA polymerase sigma factor (sigma-70 family)